MKAVSVFLITYNHEQFIAQAIESIVTQKVNFDFEIIIGEDFSKDGTRAICERYAAQYPGIIRLLPSDHNYGPQGNGIRTFYECTGKYIAVCEGDDYWTDEYKLQKQFDFLEANPDFTICFSAVTIKDEMGWNWPDERYFPKLAKDVFTIEDFILSTMNIIPTATLFFRNVLPRPFPDFYVRALAGDIGIQLFTADKGKAKCLPGKMAVYRNHPGGATKSPETIRKGAGALRALYEEFNKYFGYRYNQTFRKRFFANAKVDLIYYSRDKKGTGKLKHYFKIMPQYLKYADKLNLKEILYFHVVLFFPSLLKNFKRDA